MQAFDAEAELKKRTTIETLDRVFKVKRGNLPAVVPEVAYVSDEVPPMPKQRWNLSSVLLLLGLAAAILVMILIFVDEGLGY